ncbi:MAG TPA: P-loop NTPase fold protein [Longimicrobiaceae bacterium]
MSKIKILYFAADPLYPTEGRASARLRLEEEAYRIVEEVRRTEHRDTLEFNLRLTADVNNLMLALQEARPQVVHFSTHGSPGGLVLAGSDGQPHVVRPAALRKLFGAFRGDVHLVLLNACLVKTQAEAIAGAVGCVVGTHSSISDEAAITFAASFYRAVMSGQSVRMAYDLARATLALDHPEDSGFTELVLGPGVDPGRLILIPGGDPDPDAEGTPRTSAPVPLVGTESEPRQSPWAGQPDSLENAYALLQEAVRSLAERTGGAVPAEAVKQRMLELSPDFDETALGFSNFKRFLRQAHDSEAVDLRQTADGGYEAALPASGRRYSPPVPPAPGLIGEEHPPVDAAATEADAPPPVTVRDPRNEAVPMHADDPATTDHLQRRPFAEVIGARMNEVRAAQQARDGEGSAFMVHVHGPWGAGKTSVLNFLRAYLQDETRRGEPRWVVVDFNAWRHQRIRPPWWSLLREVYAQAARQLGWRRSLWLRVQWLWWRFRADWVPAAAALLLIVVTVALTVGALSTVLSGADASPPPSPGGESDGTAKSIELALKILTALFAAGGAVLAASRSLVFGSSSAAQAYASLRSDPLSPIVRLFGKVVTAVGQPVAVFVDDLDRCDGAYVVELLEGIQTLFRTASVTYVVAADRKWICSSFEKRYGDFGEVIGEPGRPLGYLFLDKIFQVSATVPRPSPEVRAAYWTKLLHAPGGAAADPEALDAARREAEERAVKKIGLAHTQEELQARIAEAAADPQSGHLDEQAMRAAAARRITTPEARRATEHRLQHFAGLLEPNPRSMKRLVNAFGLHQATHFLEGRSVAPDVLARWTIVELRWPLLADYLAARPQAADDLAEGRPPEDDRLAGDLKPLFGDSDVLAVVRGNVGTGGATLSAAAIHEIVGDGGTAPAAADRTG